MAATSKVGAMALRGLLGSTFESVTALGEEPDDFRKAWSELTENQRAAYRRILVLLTAADLESMS